MKTSKIIAVVFSAFLLTACVGEYKVDVDIEPEQVAEIKAEIKQIESDIANYDESNTDPENTPPYLLTIDMANAYAEMGEIGKAIKVYQDAIGGGMRGTAIYNNLGRLYETKGDYESAIEVYQQIIDEFFDQSYLYDITWAYIKAGDSKMAAKFFNAWQLEFQKTDEQTQEAIKKLKETEKASK